MTNELMNHFSDVMSDHIDSGKKITHEQLGEMIEGKLEDTKFWKKLDGNGVSPLVFTPAPRVSVTHDAPGF